MKVTMHLPAVDGEHWTWGAIAGLVGQRPTITEPGRQATGHVVAARRADDGGLDIDIEADLVVLEPRPLVGSAGLLVVPLERLGAGEATEIATRLLQHAAERGVAVPDVVVCTCTHEWLGGVGLGPGMHAADCPAAVKLRGLP